MGDGLASEHKVITIPLPPEVMIPAAVFMVAEATLPRVPLIKYFKVQFSPRDSQAWDAYTSNLEEQGTLISLQMFRPGMPAPIPIFIGYGPTSWLEVWQ